jgi:hypothetical protein
MAVVMTALGAFTARCMGRDSTLLLAGTALRPDATVPRKLCLVRLAGGAAGARLGACARRSIFKLLPTSRRANERRPNSSSSPIRRSWVRAAGAQQLCSTNPHEPPHDTPHALVQCAAGRGFVVVGMAGIPRWHARGQRLNSSAPPSLASSATGLPAFGITSSTAGSESIAGVAGMAVRRVRDTAVLTVLRCRGRTWLGVRRRLEPPIGSVQMPESGARPVLQAAKRAGAASSTGAPATLGHRIPP